MKTIYSLFDKDQISNLPIVHFSGRIYVITSRREAERAVEHLLTAPILGIDTETRPSFKKGQSNKVALLQVATHEACFLFRLNRIGMTAAIIRLLENKQVKMIGLSLHDDIAMLHRRAAFTPGYFIDLQQQVREIGIEDMSLKKIYANLFHEKISKRQQLSNWEADNLTEKQQQYAAIDAWACIKIYEEVCRLRDEKDYNLIVVPRPEPAEQQHHSDNPTEHEQ